MRILSGVEKEKAELFMTEATRVAKKATCHKAHCGTVIVKDDQILGEGWNSPPLEDESQRTCNVVFGHADKESFDTTCCIHAEWRAIMNALRDHGKEIQGAQLYFARVDDDGKIKKSAKPYCTVCSRLALESGVATFLLWGEEGICEFDTSEYNRLSYAYFQ
jgi:deoxycytidylate deaminase